MFLLNESWKYFFKILVLVLKCPTYSLQKIKGHVKNKGKAKKYYIGHLWDATLSDKNSQDGLF